MGFYLTGTRCSTRTRASPAGTWPSRARCRRWSRGAGTPWRRGAAGGSSRLYDGGGAPRTTAILGPGQGSARRALRAAALPPVRRSVEPARPPPGFPSSRPARCVALTRCPMPAGPLRPAPLWAERAERVDPHRHTAFRVGCSTEPAPSASGRRNPLNPFIFNQITATPAPSYHTFPLAPTNVKSIGSVSLQPRCGMTFAARTD